MAPRPIKSPEPEGPVVTDYVCGLRKIGPSKYSVVSGRIIDGVVELKVEPISEDLGHSAEALRSEFQKLVKFIP